MLDYFFVVKCDMGGQGMSSRNSRLMINVTLVKRKSSCSNEMKWMSLIWGSFCHHYLL